MKLLVLTLVMAAASIQAHDHEHYILKKWAVHKAFEGCFGKDVMKLKLVKIKTAYSKCQNTEAPELDLPIFQSTYRASGALAKTAYANNKANDVSLEQMMKKYLLRKAFEDFMDGDDGDRFGFEPERRHRHKFYNRRYRRDHHTEDAADPAEEIALGDRLNEKLQMIKQEIQYQFGNYTCMLRELGYLDSDNNLNTIDALVEQLEAYGVEDEWLKNRVEDDLRMCHSIASSLPKEYLEECYFGPEMQKVKHFKECTMKRKLRTCMNYDIKQQLEENFAPLEELVEQTDMEEENLLPLVRKLLHGEQENDMKTGFF